MTNQSKYSENAPKFSLRPKWWRSRSAEEIMSDSDNSLNDNSRLSTGSCTLDKLFNGGIPKHILFEISGEAGTGKTQWCLSLTASVLLRNIDFDCINEDTYNACGVVCIIYTENGIFSKKRLYEIISSKIEFEIKKRGDSNNKNITEFIAKKLIKYVRIYKIDTLKDLESFIQGDIPFICLNHKIDAIIIDSITNIYRSKISFSDNNSVSTGLLQISNIFKRVVFDQNCWFIVTNQTITDINNSISDNKKPCLGLLWSNAVNWRIFLSKKVYNNNTKRQVSIYLSSEVAKIK